MRTDATAAAAAFGADRRCCSRTVAGLVVRVTVRLLLAAIPQAALAAESPPDAPRATAQPPANVASEGNEREIERLQNAAETAQKNDEHQRAQQLWEEVLDRATLAYGKTHWRVIEATLQLKHLRRQASLSPREQATTEEIKRLAEIGIRKTHEKDRKSANEAIDKALSLSRDLWGEDDVAYFLPLKSSATLAHYVADHRRAVSLMEKSLAIQVRVRGEQHPETEATYGILFTMCEYADDPGHLERIARRGLELVTRVYGADDLRAARWLARLGQACKAKEDYPAAKTYYEKARLLFEELKQTKSLDYAETLLGLAGVANETGEYALARKWAKEAGDIVFREYGETIRYVVALHMQADSLMNLNDYSAAKPLLLEALRLSSRIQPGYSEHLHSLRRLGDLYRLLGEYAAL